MHFTPVATKFKELMLAFQPLSTHCRQYSCQCAASLNPPLVIVMPDPSCPQDALRYFVRASEVPCCQCTLCVTLAMLCVLCYVVVCVMRQIVKRELTLEEKKKFLKFFTGSDR